MRLIAEAWHTIDRVYVNQDAVEPRPMAYGATDGMVQTLGDAGHTRFLTPEMVEQHRNLIQGQFEGIGAYVEMRDGEVVIQAVRVASHFLEDGIVLTIKGAAGEIREVPAETDIEATALPMVVLVNGGTASGAEVVTGALQDAERAMVLGTTTFGTGTVLQELELADGSVLLLAVEEWRTPAGHVIWHEGLEPGIEVTRRMTRPWFRYGSGA